jgi:hypothetical protein
MGKNIKVILAFGSGGCGSGVLLAEKRVQNLMVDPGRFLPFKCVH